MFYLSIVFIMFVFYKLFYSNAVHTFPVYGTIKCYCIVLHCISVCLHSSLNILIASDEVFMNVSASVSIWFLSESVILEPSDPR